LTSLTNKLLKNYKFGKLNDLKALYVSINKVDLGYHLIIRERYKNVKGLLTRKQFCHE